MTKPHDVRSGSRTYDSPGHYWLEIPVRKEQIVWLEDFADYLTNAERSQKRYFTLWGMLKIGMCPMPPPTINQDRWFCSQLVVFALQGMNILSDELNASRLHPTEVFILCRLGIVGAKGILRPVQTSKESSISREELTTTIDECFKQQWGRELDRERDLPTIPALCEVMKRKF